MKPIELLIVDDNVSVCESMAKYFSKIESIKIVGIAHNSTEAIQIVKARTPDVILLDIVMPRSDGFVLLEYINANHVMPNPKVIVVSSMNNDSNIHRACQLGAAYFLAKPISLRVLQRRIEEIYEMDLENKVI